MNLSLRAREPHGLGITAAAGSLLRRKRIAAIPVAGLWGLMLISSPEAADSQKQGLAKIAALQNQVETRSGGQGAWSPSALNQPLFGHDRVRTGPASRAALLYSDQTLHRLGEKLCPLAAAPGAPRGLEGRLELRDVGRRSGRVQSDGRTGRDQYGAAGHAGRLELVTEGVERQTELEAGRGGLILGPEHLHQQLARMSPLPKEGQVSQQGAGFLGAKAGDVATILFHP